MRSIQAKKSSDVAVGEVNEVVFDGNSSCNRQLSSWLLLGEMVRSARLRRRGCHVLELVSV